VELATEQLASGAKVSTWAWRAPDRPWDVDGSLLVGVSPSQAPKLLEQRRPRKVDPDLPAGFVALSNRLAAVAEQARLLAKESRHPAAVMVAHTLRLVVNAADSYVAARGEGLEVSAETRLWGHEGDEESVSVVLTMHPMAGRSDVERAEGLALTVVHEQHPWIGKGESEAARQLFVAEVKKRAVRILNARGLKGAALYRAAEKLRDERRARENASDAKAAS
jgi:hypothetical protein